MLKNLISYYRSCYQADYRAISLSNFFGTKAENTLILESADLIAGKLLDFPVATKWGTAITEKLAVYAKEKELYCGAFFLFGSMMVGGRKLDVTAPLFLYPTILKEEKEIFYVSIDANNPIINPAIVQIAGEGQTGLWELLNKVLPKGFLKFDEKYQLIEVLQTHLPTLDITEIDHYPTLFNQAALKDFQTIHRAKEGFTLIPACGLCLLNKPTGSRGILNELKTLAQSAKFSPPIQEIFGQKQSSPKKSTDTIAVPIILSKNQQAVIHSAMNHHLSLVIGPPGTGKSFTIAALAVEFLSKGKTVLIASKNNQAGKVVADKIEKDFNLAGIVVRAGKKDYKQILQKRLKNWLSGIGVAKPDKYALKKLKKKIAVQSKWIEQEEIKVLNRLSSEQYRGTLLLTNEEGIITRIKKYFLTRTITKEIPLWQKKFSLETALSQKNQLLKQYIKLNFARLLFQALNYSRSEIKQLVSALMARTGNKKASIFDKINFRKVLKALPIWIANSTDIHKVLPLTKELFDLVIIDEATQCDIASSLPILQRGKRAVIVGDPKQLRHISFLSTKQQQHLIQQHQLGTTAFDQLDYRNNSILDIVSHNIPSQTQVHFLNEHFRSMPDIIDFSNQYFYDGQLRIMTAQPKTLHKQHVFLQKVTGKRYKRGYNKMEAQAVLTFLSTLLKNQSPLNEPQSIGIVSPFSAQANHLQRQLTKSFSAEVIERYQILVGTPHHFQGEERDIILISLALDDNSHAAAFHYLNKEDVFNVSITRARKRQYVFHSFDREKLNPKSLTARYLQRLTHFSGHKKINPNASLSNPFLEEVLTIVQSIEPDEILIAFPIAGIEIDIVVIKNNRTYCIDLIGFPGVFEEALSLERWRMLERVGLRIFYLPFSQWHYDKNLCERAILIFLAYEKT